MKLSFISFVLAVGAGCYQGEHEEFSFQVPEATRTRVCDLEEIEPNNEINTPSVGWDLSNANFGGSLPTLTVEKICGELFITTPAQCAHCSNDNDAFLFLIDPSVHPSPSISCSFRLETDSNIVVRLKLYQTIFDDGGHPTGSYNVLGDFYSSEGEIVVLDWLIPYDIVMQRDLYVIVEGAGGLMGFYDYELEYWN